MSLNFLIQIIKFENNYLSEESSDEETPPCNIEINALTEEAENSTT